MVNNIDKNVRDKFKDFLSEYNYDENPFNNIYSIYDFTDFIQLNLKDSERIPFIKYFTEEFAKGEELEFLGNLHEITILNDDETEEFLGNLVHFYHGVKSLRTDGEDLI